MTSVVPMVLGIPNVGLHVSSIDDSLPFYRDLLGMRLLMDSGWISDAAMLAHTATPGGSIRIVNLATAGTTGAGLSLVQVDGIARKPLSRREFHDPGAVHVAFDVDSLDATLARLVEAGVELVAAPGEVSGGGPGHARIVFVRDPDAFFVQLVQRLPKT
jgi:catechol 2,3-dioxygenase-like lactoylglutathione lyase family enzyme